MINLTEEQLEIMHHAMIKWGPESQILLACEEMSELIKELLKTFRGNYSTDIQQRAKTNENIREELGDVIVCMHQIAMIFDPFYHEVKASLEKKMERTLKKLEEENEKP